MGLIILCSYTAAIGLVPSRGTQLFPLGVLIPRPHMRRQPY